MIVSEKGVKEARSDKEIIDWFLQNSSKHVTEPKNAKQFEMAPENFSSGGYENIVTTMDLFFR